MPIETTPVTTATTPLSDEQILTHLVAEARRRASDPRLKFGDVVDVNDPAVIERCQVLRPFGVVISFDPIDKIARVLVVNVSGVEMPLALTGAQLSLRQ